MASTVPACMLTMDLKTREEHHLTWHRYNGTSDLQLERMNVYFNEVWTTEAAAYARSKTTH